MHINGKFLKNAHNARISSHISLFREFLAYHSKIGHRGGKRVFIVENTTFYNRMDKST